MKTKELKRSRIYHLDLNEDESENVFVMYKSKLYAMLFPDVTPDTANRNVRKLIQFDPELKEELEAANYNKCSHIFTPLQVRIIFKYLGRP